MATVYAGVVKQYIDTTVLKRNVRKDPLNCLLVPDIGGDRSPRSSDLIGNSGRGFPIGVENCDVRARRSEGQSDCSADTAASARYDGNLIFQ
jgi:hypothetical protein